ESAEDALICLRYPAISALQLPLNLLDQGALEEAIPAARERGIALIGRQCYAGGFLARPLEALGLEVIDDPARREETRKTIFKLSATAEQSHRTLRAMALQFAMGVRGISVTLVGLHTHAQLLALLADAASVTAPEWVPDR